MERKSASGASAGLDTFPKLLLRNAQKWGSKAAIREKDLGIWQTWNWSQVLSEVEPYSRGLHALGLKKGEKVAIIGDNRPRLYWTFVAAQALGAIPVPLYQDAVADEMVFVLEHAEAKVAVVENQEQVDKVMSIADRLPMLEYIIYDDSRGLREYEHKNLFSFEMIQEKGRANSELSRDKWVSLIDQGKGEDASVMLYTSGTTGKPKGVVLSNDNVRLSADAAVDFDSLDDSDTILSYLPMAWVGDHVFSYAESYVAGICIACPENSDTMHHDLVEVGPSFFFAPPRIFETMLTNVTIRMEDASNFKQGMVKYFLDVAKRCGEGVMNRRNRGSNTGFWGGVQNFARSYARPFFFITSFFALFVFGSIYSIASSGASAGSIIQIFLVSLVAAFVVSIVVYWLLRNVFGAKIQCHFTMDVLKYWIGDLLVYGPLKNTLGFSNIRVGYTAGEAVGPEIFSFYRSLGINLKQLYGQTEATVFVTVQPDGGVRADTVGVPAPGVDIKINDNGEVLFKSPGVFQEYYKNAKATAETKTKDGWVYTGDAGFFESDGQLKIIDRAKDVGKLTNGNLFAPKYIENKLKFFANIKEVVTVGDGRDYAAAMINIDLQAVGNWAERNNVSYASYQELAGHPTVYEMIGEHVRDMNKLLAEEPNVAGGQIKRFLILHKELDADDGELTRTLKVRRPFVFDRYEPLIEALYDGSTEKYVNTEVTFEDGRSGEISATVQIVDSETFPIRQAVKEAAE
ncbi:MAG: AMP-binding protein [Hyphomicrobiales bacterium]